MHTMGIFPLEFILTYPNSSWPHQEFDGETIRAAGEAGTLNASQLYYTIMYRMN